MKLLTDKDFLKLTLPLMISTMTQPLMGAVNTAVMGQLPDAKYIAAVSLGAILFNNIYWLFGFLRVSTTAYAAQAHGARDVRLSMLAFFKPLVVAAVLSLLCIILQTPIINAYLSMINPTQEVAELCRTYYDILIWGAPLVLGNYVVLGWLMGQSHIRASVFMQMSMNVLNMILSTWFVFELEGGIEGVAHASLLCQIYGAIMSAILICRFSKFNYNRFPWEDLLDWHAFIDMLRVNSDLMIRTACLLTVNNVIAAVGASFGTTVLAANAVLLQIKDIMSYLIDGMANSTAILTGRAIGQRSIEFFNQVLRTTFKWVGILTAILMGIYFVGSTFFIKLFTDLRAVIEIAESNKIFVLIYPLCSCIALVLYGAFCGATYTKTIRNMMIISLSLFYAVQHFAVLSFNNDGLWYAFLLFYICQSIILSINLSSLKKKISSEAL